jgi:hypothetical protein
MQAQGNFKRGTAVPLAALRSPRAQWVEAFSSALMDLRPHLGQQRTRRLACDLWGDLGHFDPVMAAELEYESSLCDA